MSKHDPAGTTLCIHSVVTTHAMRRRGVAQKMLAEYIAHVRAEAPSVALIKLLTKPANASLCAFAFAHCFTPLCDRQGAVLKPSIAVASAGWMSCHADEKAGFNHLGEWAGEHGSEAWFEMELRL